jgi:putative SOS response-associated peptidase YedK
MDNWLRNLMADRRKSISDILGLADGGLKSTTDAPAGTILRIAKGRSPMMNFDPVQLICRKLGITPAEWKRRSQDQYAKTNARLEETAKRQKMTDEVLNKRCTL